MIYFFTVLFWIIAISMISGYIFNSELINWFEWLCSLLCLLIFTIFSHHFLQVRIVLKGKTVRLVKSMWVKNDKMEKQKIKNMLFYYKNREQKIVIEQFNVDMLEKYGFAKDIEMGSFEKSPVLLSMYNSQNIIFISKDGTSYSLNPRPYTKRSIRVLKNHIMSQSGLMPIGKLNDL